VSGLFSVSTELVFTGENFINTTNVLVGSKNCVVKDKNETHLVCTSQPQDTYGAYVVNVTTTLGTVTAPVHGFFAYGLERRASIFGTMTNMATEDGIVTGGLILSINLVQDMFTRALQTGSALAESFFR
jgi:formylmethanofuran dehydrogenase subunit E-like metal-binding protein